MKIDPQLSDEAVLKEIGGRIARRRIELELTQAELAQQSGIAKRTVERMEAGAPAQTSSLVRVLRVLDLLDTLDRVLPAGGPGPMDLLKRKGRPRQRVSKRGQRGTAESWTWNDES